MNRTKLQKQRQKKLILKIFTKLKQKESLYFSRNVELCSMIHHYIRENYTINSTLFHELKSLTVRDIQTILARTHTYRNQLKY